MNSELSKVTANNIRKMIIAEQISYITSVLHNTFLHIHPLVDSYQMLRNHIIVKFAQIDDNVTNYLFCSLDLSTMNIAVSKFNKDKGKYKSYLATNATGYVRYL